MLFKHPEKILQQVHHDLTIRARGGIFIYILIWGMFAYYADIRQNTPDAFWLNTFLFIIVIFLRSIHYWLHIKKPFWNIEWMYLWLISMVLFSALHWGVMSAWLIDISPYNQLNYIAMIAMAAFAMGGTATLSIARSIRSIYPLFIYLPSIIVVFFHGEDSSEAILLSSMAVFSAIYILFASESSSKDYYSAISNRELAEQTAGKLHTLSITDSLTNLYNRMLFNERLIDEWNRCQRSNLSLSIMMIDLDYFKKINDQYGHICGDRCLQLVAQLLTEEFPRETDTVARFGGEEFVIILPDTGQDSAERIATRLLRHFRATTMSCQQHSFSITCSIGIACALPHYESNPDALLMAADEALYEAKDNGRNQMSVANIAPQNRVI